MVSMNRIGLCLVLIALLLGASVGAESQRAVTHLPAKNLFVDRQTPPSSSEAGQIVACRVLETWTVEKQGVGLALFHQARADEGAKLGESLRERDGASVEFQTPDGQWHAATVVRIGSCFGRGLLVLASSSASLARREIIQLKFPVEKGSL